MKPPTSFRPGEIPERSAECAEIITRAAEALGRRSEEVIEQLVAYALAGMEAMREESLKEDLIAAARGIVPLLTAMARSWADPHVVPPPHDSVVLVRTLVARDLSIALLLRAFRLGQAAYQQLWHQELTKSGASAAVTLEAINASSAFIFVWIDAISEPLVVTYDEEHKRWAGAKEAVRAETLAAVLASDSVDADAAEARLSYPLLHRSHVGAVVWVERSAPESVVERLTEVTSRVAGRLATSSPHSLIVSAGPRTARLWGHGEDPDPELLDDLRALVRGTGARVAVGRVGHGLDGFRRTHEEARRARRVAVHLRRNAIVTFYGEEVMVADLLIRDLASARDVAARTLGPLAAHDDAARRLLATLTIFVEEGGSIARTARRLGLHENTVSYRLRRAAQVSGHASVDSVSLRAAVQLAPLLDSDADAIGD